MANGLADVIGRFVARDADGWLLASYHVSLNALDNPLINSAKKSLIGVAVGTAFIGLILGWLIGRRKKA